MAPRSKLFCPYKVVGVVSMNMPFVYDYCITKKQYFMKIPLGNCFHIYRAKDLRLTDVSRPLSDAICSIALGAKIDCTATRNGRVYVWDKGSTKLVKEWQCHNSAIPLLCVMGTTIASVDTENILKVSQTDGSLYLDIQLPLHTFHATAMMHPETYMNKILIGSRQGKLQLWNIKTSKMIYEFKGWGSAVSVVIGSPAKDVVAIGLDDGRIIIHNILVDETVMSLQQDSGKVTALCFRSDNNARLLSGSHTGSVYVWNLTEKSLMSTIKRAHDGPILSLSCAVREPLAYTSSTDNVIKSWVFDMSDGGGRPTKSRAGHSAPPLRVRYHGHSGEGLISAGQDSTLRRSVVQSGNSLPIAVATTNKKEKKYNKKAVDIKMPPIINFSTEIAREKAWDSVAAIHQNSFEVTTYSIYLSSINDRRLVHPRFKESSYNSNAMATCIEISKCGNFVFVGFNTGHIDKFNMQSGLYQLTYGGDKENGAPVRGVVTDVLNQWVVSGDQDGNIQWWQQRNGKKDKTVELEAGVCSMVLHRESGLFAAALDDWMIIIADVDTKTVVRKLKGHHNQITDMAFTADSRWLISSSMDCSIRTWDLPTGCLVDHFKVPSPATSIAVSPMDDYLATTHVDERGVYIWCNRSCLTFVSLAPLSDDHIVPLLPLPGSTHDGAQVFDSDDEDSDIEDDDDVQDYKSPDQLSDQFITIELMPASRWLHLLNIDQIKKRNKPDEIPKAPKSAPFFLETASGIQGMEIQSAENEEYKSKVIDSTEFVMERLSPFGKLLNNGSLNEAFQKLLSMGPSSIDLEIRNLDPDVGGNDLVMMQFLHMIKEVITKNKHFEVAQGYLALFMKRHPEFMSAPNPDLEKLCTELAEQHNKSWHALKDDINKSLCLLSYFKNSAILNY